MYNDPDYKVKIKVQTLDSDYNPVIFWKDNINFDYSGISNASEDININVPTSGRYTIQVELSYSECTWQNTNCTDAGKKIYFTQNTYDSPQTTHYFEFPDIEDEDCEC